MKKRNHIIAIFVLGIALAVAFVVVAGVPWGYRATAPTGKVSGQNPAIGTAATSSPLAAKTYLPHPPHGSVTYQIAQAATQLPAFVQTTIDPADVSPGQVQKFDIVTNDPNPVTSVVAVITTDHKTITVPLVSKGVPAVSMLVPRTIYVTSDNTLALVVPGATAPNIAETKQGAHIANAANGNDTEFTGQWTVEDTHSARYQTVFIAKDSAGNENSVTLGWADSPCPFSSVNNYSSSTLTISSSCSIDSVDLGTSDVDGPENGNLAVTAGTLTVVSYNTLVLNSGYFIQLSGTGAIFLSTANANIQLGQDMCGTDNDGDGYAASSNWTHAASCTLSRKNLLGLGDCDDSDANVYPGQTGWFTNISNGGTWDYNCDGTVTQNQTTTGSITTVGGCVDSACVNPVFTFGWSGSVPACGVTAGVVDIFTGEPANCGRTILMSCNIAQSGGMEDTQACH